MYWKITGRVGWVLIAIAAFFVGQKSAYNGVEKQMREITTSITRGADGIYMLTDLTLRSYHYAKPHKHPVTQCPECYDIVNRIKNQGKVVTKLEDLK